MFCANCGKYLEAKNSYKENGFCSQDCVFEYMKQKNDPAFLKKKRLEAVKRINNSVIEFEDIPSEFKTKTVQSNVW